MTTPADLTDRWQALAAIPGGANGAGCFALRRSWGIVGGWFSPAMRRGLPGLDYLAAVLVIEGFVKGLLGNAGLTRHRPDQVLAKRRLWAIDRDLVPMPAHVLDPVLV